MHPGVNSWKNLVLYALYAFSVPLLLRTLFAPWKMDRDADGAGFSVLEKAVFFILSRVLGFAARIVLIVCGLVFAFLSILSFPVFFLLPIKISRESLLNLGSVGASLSYGATYTLSRYGRDLMNHTSEKIYGKEKALRMIERGLTKESARNVLLMGEVGVGKSSLLGHLGRLGRSGFSPKGVRNHRVVELPVEGMPEEDFNRSLSEAEAAGNIILVIENIHNFTGIYERLLPYLSSSRLGIIATTNLAAYDRELKKHPEFLSKFSKVELLPPGPDETLAILENRAQIRGLRTEEGALREVVRLTDRFIGNQSQPMKSINILDELETLGRKITIEDVRQIISDRTNVPVGAIGADERQVLLGLETKMKKKIIGQDEAVGDVAEALRRLRAGISDPSKPAGSFLFLGPTGVGKTYTAKILSESYFGRRNAMIRFDMSEFSLASSVETFSDRLGAVIEEAPLSLVFFDELEKAHPSIHHLLLSVLDEGRLTRASGRTAYFKNSLIIATSNAGSVDIIQNPGIEKKTLIATLIRRGIFTPEFLNRWSSVVLFQPLDPAEAREITKLMLEEFAERLLEDKNINLVVTDALVDRVASAGFDPEFGARPIKRAMEELVENKVAEYILTGNVGGVLKIV